VHLIIIEVGLNIKGNAFFLYLGVQIHFGVYIPTFNALSNENISPTPMKKDTADTRTIVLMIFVVLIVLRTPITSYIVFGLCLVYLAYNLYSKIQYRQGKTDYLLFPTKNDSFVKITSLTLGLIIFSIGIIYIIWTKNFNPYAFAGMAIGLLQFLNGLFALPKGRMKIEAHKLVISDLEDKLDLRQLKEINIYQERILLTNIYDETERVDHLAIDPDSSKLIDNYISKNHADLKIVNHVS